MSNSSKSLYIREVGPADAPTLIFLHGGGGSGWMWNPQITEFSRNYHCLIPDLPQHGNSGGSFTMRGAAKLVAECISKRAHGGKAHVIGLSLGAQVAVELLATTPERAITALISSSLLRPLPGAALYTKSLLRWTYLLTVSPLKRSAWFARLNMRYAAGIPDRYFDQFMGDYTRLNAESFAQVMTENLHYRLPGGFSQTALPVLVIVGQREGKAMTQSARDLIAALPNAQGRVVDVGRSTAQNHNWGINAPELFNRMVRAWVEQQPLPPELKPL